MLVIIKGSKNINRCLGATWEDFYINANNIRA